MERPLLQKTQELLENCELGLTEIANMSGLGYEWLKKFKAKQIPDPGVARVETLYNFLAGRQSTGSKKKPVAPEKGVAA